MNMFIIKMPADAALTELSEQAQELIRTNVKYPMATMPGTRAVGGYRLLFGMTSMSLEEVNGAISSEGIDWTILGMRSWQSQIQTDEEGNHLLDAEGRRVIAPTEYMALSQEIWDYIHPLNDEEGNPLPLPDQLQMPMYSKRGVEPWILGKGA